MFKSLSQDECSPAGYFSGQYGSCVPISTGRPCETGFHFDALAGCVIDDPSIIIDVKPPATAPTNFWLYAGGGLILLMLVGGFIGGRASKSTGATPGTRKRVTKSFWVTF